MALYKVKKKWVPAAIIAVVVIVGMYLIPAFSKIFGSIGTAIKSTFGAVNTGVNTIAREVGLDEKTNDQVQALLTAPITDPWNPSFYQSYFDAGTTNILTSAAADDLIAQIHVFQSPMKLGQADVSGYVGLVQSLPSQCHFSSLCYFFQKENGTGLATWMSTGWLFGAVCSMGNAEMAEVDSAVRQLPIQSLNI